jgi:hypothetical protein
VEAEAVPTDRPLRLPRGRRLAPPLVGAGHHSSLGFGVSVLGPAVEHARNKTGGSVRFHDGPVTGDRHAVRG